MKTSSLKTFSSDGYILKVHNEYFILKNLVMLGKGKLIHIGKEKLTLLFNDAPIFCIPEEIFQENPMTRKRNKEDSDYIPVYYDQRGKWYEVIHKSELEICLHILQDNIDLPDQQIKNEALELLKKDQWRNKFIFSLRRANYSINNSGSFKRAIDEARKKIKKDS